MDYYEQLFADYVSYWRVTACVNAKWHEIRAALRPPKMTRERLAALRRMAEFARENGADPRLWLYTLFMSRQFIYPPKFECLTPKSHLKCYLKEHRLGLFAKKMAGERQRRRNNDADQYDPNRDIAQSVEDEKGHLLRTGQQQVCFDRMESITLGFHPRSKICAMCPIQTSCADALMNRVAFDIIALRRGDITVDDAQRAAESYYKSQMRPSGDHYEYPAERAARIR